MLTFVSGGGQANWVGAPLVAPVVVRLTRMDGSGVAGEPITFTPSGDGTVTPSTAMTGSDGTVSVRWQLGTRPALERLSAAAIDPVTGQALPPLAVTATSAAGPAALVTAAAGNGQTEEIRFALASAPVARVTDRFGNAVPSVTVSFSTGTGNGSVSPAMAMTDASGNASTRWTLGTNVGQQTMQAAAAGLEPAVFTATATEGLPFDGYYVGTHSSSDPYCSYFDRTLGFPVKNGLIGTPDHFGCSAEVDGTMSTDGSAYFTHCPSNTTMRVIYRGNFVLDGNGGATGSGTTENWCCQMYGGCPTWTVTRQ
jgi:hypothetical protein